MTSVRGVDGARLMQTLRQLARVGADPRGGVSRLGLTAAERDAREYLGELSEGAGLAARVDAAGNLLIGRADAVPGRPVMLMGSHLDSVLQGGWLDGAYGVTAALQVLEILAREAGDSWYEPVVVGFANEEGALVQCPFWGSRALTGTLDAAGLACDRDGRPAGDYLKAAGGDPAALADAAWPAGRIAGYLELHIEQGPVLEQRRVPIGVVSEIVGRRIFEIELRGVAAHAGTTPMAGRRDALTAAARLILQVERLATELAACATATVGFLSVAPNMTNTVPGVVGLTAEIRDPDPARLLAGAGRLAAVAAGVQRETGVEVAVRETSHAAAVATSPVLRDVVAGSARELGLPSLTMPSGAGHDAQVVAGLAPAGMIFVPSKGGLSHTPGEDTAAAELVDGADVLLFSMLALAGDPGDLAPAAVRPGTSHLEGQLA
ncbi:MAG TPA: Zn-dependent hydrolase [Streptosporangiaceae bacterium]|nr:Zn-dependent hydrolase [Streptosporangiaceae bacterium]